MEKQTTKASRPKWTGKLLAFLVTLIFSFQMLVPAYAYTLVYIQCSIDLATWEVIAVAVRDEVGVSSASNETRRVEKSALESLKNNSTTKGGTNLSLISGLSGDVQDRSKSLADGGNIIAGLVQNIGWFEEDNRVLSFPTNQTRRDSSTSTDFNNAMNVVTDISYDLNQAFAMYCEENNITKTPDASAVHTNMVNFLTSIDSSMQNDGTVSYGGMDFKWYTEKAPGSGEYINWYMLVYEAFNNYALEGDEAVTSDNVYTSTPNQLTKALVGFFSEMLDGLRGILGMWSMDELLFNTGWRAKGYVGGIFPTSWEPYVWTLFTFMEIFAAMILLYGILNNVVKKAMSTINTIARMHFMAQLQDLLVCALALALLPIILRVVISLSSSFTAIIYNLVPDNPATNEKRTIAESVARYGSGSGSIGGIIAQFLFFGVQVSFNFLYAMRALATAILIIIAPVMIAMISVSNSRKQATIQWAKELLAQICIQPIHAFCMAVILLLPTSSHGFDNIIALYALLPFTSVLKGFFFGSAGSWAEQASQKAGKTTTGALAAGAMGIAGVAIGGTAMAIGGAMGGGSNGGQSNGGNTGDNSGSSGGEGDGSSTPPDSTALNSARGNNGAQGGQDGQGEQNKGSVGDRLSSFAAEQRAQMASHHDDAYGDNQNILGAAKYYGAGLGAAVASTAANLVSSPLGDAGRAIANTKAGKAVGRAAGKVANWAGEKIDNSRSMNALRRTNTAQALRNHQNEAPTLNDSGKGRIANVATAIGKDALNVGKTGLGAAKTGLRVGAGLAMGAAGNMIGGMGGRQLVNLGSSMVAGNRSNARPANQSDDADDRHQDSGVDNDLSVRPHNQNTPSAPEAIPDVDTFATEYAAMEAQGAGENYGIDRDLGNWVPNNSEGTIEYDFGKDDMASMGITGMHYDQKTQSVSAQFNFSKMSAQDKANAQQMVSLWQSGTAAEKSFMQQSGIKNVSPVIKNKNGQSQIVGMRMNIDKSAYAKNYGVQFDPSKQATDNGQNLTISTSAQTPPQVIPNMSRHMEAAAQKNSQSAIATDVSPLRTAMTGRQAQPASPPKSPPEAPPVPQDTPKPIDNPLPPTPPAPPVEQASDLSEADSSNPVPQPELDAEKSCEPDPIEYDTSDKGEIDPRAEFEQSVAKGLE